MRYATLTLNPCLDHLIALETSFQPGALHRFDSTTLLAGGKGVNVSRMLQWLGAKSDAFGFCGGQTGELLCSILKKEGIAQRFTKTKAQTRLCVKFTDADGICSELNAKGGPIGRAEFSALLSDMSDYLLKKNKEEEPTTVFLCGSVPRGISQEVYADLILFFDEKRVKNLRFVLDADAGALSAGLSKRPYLVKPNRAELSSVLGFTVDSAQTALYAAKRIYEEYGTRVCVTLGAEGSLYGGDEGTYLVNAPAAVLRGFVGAGDVYLATLVYSMDQKLPMEECLCRAASMAGAKVQSRNAVPPSEETVEEIAARVQVKKI